MNDQQLAEARTFVVDHVGVGFVGIAYFVDVFASGPKGESVEFASFAAVVGVGLADHHLCDADVSQPVGTVFDGVDADGVGVGVVVAAAFDFELALDAMECIAGVVAAVAGVVGV